VLDGESLYVVCGSARRVSGRQRVYWNTAVICYGLYVVKFDLGRSGGQPAWSSVLESNNSMPFYTVPMTVGRGHLVVTSRPANYQAATSAYVLDAADGQTVRQIPLSGSGQQDNFAMRRRMAIGPAVMTNNRLCVQTEDGMTILGGQ
ncbi:MAG TPA: hypothetical protein DCX07_13380, partial [Phycisphaerales bacterium]|nr:hypothetical protein [Phycisphaerales bacterium]